MQLRPRCQKPNEDFEGFADSLLELFETAYPDTAYPFKVELARDQFIQEVVVNNYIREKSTGITRGGSSRGSPVGKRA